MLAVKELTTLELLKLSLEYSISKKHQKSLVERISKLEGKPVEKEVKKKVVKKKNAEMQQSFL